MTRSFKFEAKLDKELSIELSGRSHSCRAVAREAGSRVGASYRSHAVMEQAATVGKVRAEGRSQVRAQARAQVRADAEVRVEVSAVRAAAASLQLRRAAREGASRRVAAARDAPS